MSSTNGFLERVRKKIEDLSLKEAELRQQLEMITEARERYEAAWDIYHQEMKDETEKEPSPGRRGISDEALSEMTIADASAALMREAGGAMRVADLMRRLRLAGTTKAKGSGAYSAVLKTLQRNQDRFYQIETGRWGLLETRDQIQKGALL